MNSTEQRLLDELKQSLEDELLKEVVDSYIAKTNVEGILEPLLRFLKEEISRNETS
jgi:hypothetical protein